MNRICFVILHYNVLEDTLECVESIKKINVSNSYEPIHITIVDNASPNKSGDRLINEFRGDNQVTILKNKENLGFAQGNNIGYRYAKAMFNPDFIVMINNDTLVTDNNFLLKLYEIYSEYNFHILGPDILNKEGEHQNPYKNIPTSVKEANHFILNFEKIKRRTLLKRKVKTLLPSIIYSTLIKLKKKKTNPCIVQNQVVLHGSALIFSRLFIENEENALIPDTFMYVEEDILYHYCTMKKYSMLYHPDLQIFHKEDSSTDSLMHDEKQKLEFILENHKKSYKVLSKLFSVDNVKE